MSNSKKPRDEKATITLSKEAKKYWGTEFRCPECGSREWGTNNVQDKENAEGSCHGGGHLRCTFKWNRKKEDHLYFHEKDESKINRLTIERDLYKKCVEFYADPATYFAISVFADPPCGDFASDTSDTDMGIRLGKKARQTLERATDPCRACKGEGEFYEEGIMYSLPCYDCRGTGMNIDDDEDDEEKEDV